MNGTDLKTLRKQCGLTLDQVVEQICVTKSTWCRWERDEIEIPEGYLKLFLMINKDKLHEAAQGKKNDDSLRVLGKGILIGNEVFMPN